MRKQSKVSEPELIEKLLSGAVEEKYQGKQVVVIGGEVHILPNDDNETVSLVEKLEQKYPDETPHFVFVPRPETYIL